MLVRCVLQFISIYHDLDIILLIYKNINIILCIDIEITTR